MKRLGIILFLVLILITSSGAVLFLSNPVGDSETTISYEVAPGRGFNAIIGELHQRGIINYPQLFKLYLYLTFQDHRLKVGEYTLSGGQSPAELVNILSSGKSNDYALTFPEGINMYEIADLLESKGLGSQKKFLALCRDPEFIQTLLGEKVYSLEGYLFPQTYHVTKFTKEEELIKLMVENFLSVYEELKGNHKISLPRHELVTLASIIEKETGAPDERPLISSVFHNRLRQGMKLESDPTIIYGILDREGHLVKNIRRKDIRAWTKYNTYRVKRLPHGPIANPGREALVATLNPVESPYFFFVSRNEGTHYFSKTYKEHLQAVKKFQLDAKARKGKSWRDLKRKAKSQ